MKWNFGDHLYSKCCTQIHILLLFICSPMMVLTITSRYLSTETIPLRTQTLCTVVEMPADAHICVWAGLLCDCIEWTKFCPTCRKSSQSLRLLMNPIQFPKTALDCTSACATNQANRTAGLKLKGQISDVFHSLGLDLRNRGGQSAIWAMPEYTRFFFGWGFPKWLGLDGYLSDKSQRSWDGKRSKNSDGFWRFTCSNVFVFKTGICWTIMQLIFPKRGWGGQTPNKAYLNIHQIS